MTNEDDDPQSYFMIRSSKQVSSTVELPNLSESGLADWLFDCKASRASPISRRLSASAHYWSPGTAAHPVKLDSDKFGDEAARPNRWLD